METALQGPVDGLANTLYGIFYLLFRYCNCSSNLHFTSCTLGLIFLALCQTIRLFSKSPIMYMHFAFTHIAQKLSGSSLRTSNVSSYASFGASPSSKISALVIGSLQFDFLIIQTWKKLSVFPQAASQ